METERKGPTGVTLPAKSSGHTFGDVGGGSPVYATGAAKQRPEAVWRGISASLNDMLRDMTTVRNRAEPHGSTVVISLNMYRVKVAHADTLRGAL